MITQRLKIDGANIVKQDGSLYSCWGHNYDNINILDIGAYGELIENVWGEHMYATGGIFTPTNVSWVWTGTGTIYEITLTLAEPLASNTFVVGTDYITITGSPTFVGYNVDGGAAINLSIEGASKDGNVNRSTVSNINTSTNTIKFTQDLKNFVADGSATINKGLVGIGSIEYDLAVMKKIANTNIIRICLQLDKFMLDDIERQAAVDSGSTSEGDVTDTSTTKITDPYTVKEYQLNKLYEFCNLAAKYDIYLIINGANAWASTDQPNWLAWASGPDRWYAQKAFWTQVASKIGIHPAVAWYSLINEPADQNDDAQVFDYNSTTKTLNAVGVFQMSGISNKKGKSGYAIISDKTNTLFQLVRYDNLDYIVIDNTIITLTGVVLNQYGSYDEISDFSSNDVFSNCYISFINKADDINDLKVVQTTEGSKTAVIDLYSNAKSFKGATTNNTYIPSFGFLGDTYTAATRNSSSDTWGGDQFSPPSTIPIGVTAKSNRYSSLLLSSFPSTTEVNYGVSGSILSSNGEHGGIPVGYGQVLKNYPNGNTYKVNSLNFGKNDFLTYGLTKGYNADFFIQSLRTVLSRLRSKYVQEIENVPGFPSSSFTTVTSSSASGGSYKRAASSTSVQFTTPSTFNGETIAIGFMVEYGADAVASISVNGKTYKQSLISGTDVYKPDANNGDYSALPVVKRIYNLPSGVNTLTITLTVSNTSACLDYWQIESTSPAPTIINSIDNNINGDLGMSAFPTASGTTYTYTTTSHHGLLPGMSVIIGTVNGGVNYAAFNGTFKVQSTPTLNTFTVVGSVSNPTATSFLLGAGGVLILGLHAGDVQTFGNPVIQWNQKIVDLIYSEFFDGDIFYLDVNSILSKSTDYDSNNYLNDSGHSKLSLANRSIVINNNMLPVYGVAVSGTTYTYTTGDAHNLRVGSVIVIQGATPSNINGRFTVTSVPSAYKFTVTGPSISSLPSAENASYSLQQLQTKTTYAISSDNIPENGQNSFTTGDSIVDTGGLYTITLTNTDGVITSSTPQSCSITNNTQWIGTSAFGIDRHYTPYITLTPRTKSKTQIANEWVTTMVSAIKTVDPYTPITVNTTIIFGNELDSDTGGFGPTNLNNITVDGKPAIDILSVHQYPSTPQTINKLADNIKTIANSPKDQNGNTFVKPVILEEGALPYGSSYRQTANYLLKSKRYLAGALNNYQGYYPIPPYGWVPWTNDYLDYQYTFDKLAPFMNDTPLNDENVSIITGSNDERFDSSQLINFIALKDNKPRVTGRRYLSPVIDQSSSGFTFDISADTKPPSSYSNLTVDGSYVAQTQLVKNGTTLPQSTFIWFNGTSVSNTPTENMYLNSIYKGSNQDILSVKTVANLKHGSQMTFRNRRPSYFGQKVSTQWSIYPSGSDFTAAVNAGGTTNLSSNITSTADSITINVLNTSAFANTGVVLIDEEYIKYSAKTSSSLTVASGGRGYYDTIAATHTAGIGNVRGCTPLGSPNVRTSGTNVAANWVDWTLPTPAALPSGKNINKFNVFVCLKIDTPTLSYATISTEGRVATKNTTLTSSNVLQFGSNNLTNVPHFVIGAYLGGTSNGNIPAGAFISAINRTTGAVTMSKIDDVVGSPTYGSVIAARPSSTIPTGANVVTTGAPQVAKIEFRSGDAERFFLYKTLVYKGGWLDDAARATHPDWSAPDYPQITYAKSDLVSYNNKIYQSLSDGNRHSITDGSSNSYWKLIQSYENNPTGFAWIKMSFILENGIWKDYFDSTTPIALPSYGSYGQLFNPDTNDFAVRVSNTNIYAPAVGVSKYISISTIYADAYTNGNVAPLGTEVLQGQLWLSGDNADQSGARLSFANNTTNGWVSSGDGINLNQFTQTILDSPMSLRFVPKSTYTTSNADNLNINTAYVEVKIKETLSTKGTPIVSMG